MKRENKVEIYNGGGMGKVAVVHQGLSRKKRDSHVPLGGGGGGGGLP